MGPGPKNTGNKGPMGPMGPGPNKKREVWAPWAPWDTGPKERFGAHGTRAQQVVIHNQFLKNYWRYGPHGPHGTRAPMGPMGPWALGPESGNHNQGVYMTVYMFGSMQGSRVYAR